SVCASLAASAAPTPPPPSCSPTMPSRAADPPPACSGARACRPASTFRSASPSQNPEAAATQTGLLDELLAVAQASIELEGRTPSVGGVRKHVVDGDQRARCHVRDPRLLVGAHDVVTVTAVDEEERERCRPPAGDGDRVADDADHAVFESGLLDGASE